MEGSTLGAHLRRRRHALQIRQSDAANIVGCDPKSYLFWERDGVQPFVQFYPGIIRFLGYEPWPEPGTLAEGLLAERRRQGVEIRKAASLTDVDEGTWGRWERGK